MVKSFNDLLFNYYADYSAFFSGFTAGFLLGVVSDPSSFHSETFNEAISNMFSALNYFSTIPCPDDLNCLLPHCLFSHSTSLVGTPTPDVSSPAQTPNKRRKVFDDGPLTSLQRTVSPPPLRSHGSPQKEKLKVVSSAKKVEAKSVPANPGPAVAKPAVLKQMASKPLVVKPVQATPDFKIEPLYPRKISREPARFQLRIMLIKALHDQYCRLNEEHLKSQDGPNKVPLHGEQELISMALDDEERAALEKPFVYSNVVKNRISVLKKMSLADWRKELLTKMLKAEKDAEEATNGKATDPPPPIVTGLTPREEQALLPRIVASLENLQEYGYVLSPPSEKEVAEAKRGIEASQGWEVCDRCEQRFQVFPGRREEDGALAGGGACTYHYGRRLQPEHKKDDAIKGHVLKKWTCCDQPIGSPGCTTAPAHVFNVKEVKRLASVLQFERTPPNPDVSNEAAICMDCEMCYTVNGLELVRLTATAWPGGEEVLDVLVRPVGEIIDLNTRFSGVRQEQIAAAKPFDPAGGASLPPGEEGRALPIVPSPAAARALLFRHLNPNTPLIGHALENDLNASRIIHPTLVDTALLFPHRLGLPYRNSLKILMKNFLKRSIQMGDGIMGGHDSKEDARAAGDLVRWKVGRDWEKLRKEGWKLRDGKLLPPEGPEAGGKGKKRAGSVSLHEDGPRKLKIQEE